MKNKLLLFLGFISLIGCKNIEEKITKFIFDNSKMSTMIKYDYKYDSDRLISKSEITYIYMFGQIIDSMLVQTDFLYNNKGLLIKETSKAGFENKPSLHIYNYNSNDSLILELRINQDDDTTTWNEYAYFPDGKKTIFQRNILRHFDPNQDFIATMKNPKMDTSLYINEYEYKNNLCVSQRQHNKNRELIKTINYEYDKNKLIKEIHLTHLDSIELTEKTKFYNYLKSELEPDYYSVDSKNDTVEYCVNIFDIDKLILTKKMYDYGKIYIEDYFKNGLLIGKIDYDKKFSMNKQVISFEYYDNGLPKTEKSYREKINTH